MQRKNPNRKEEYNSQYKSYGKVLISQSERNVEKSKGKRNYKVIEHKYRIKKKGLTVVLEELKQRIQAKVTKINGSTTYMRYFPGNKFFRS